jgi:hypothetical protein
VKNEWFAQEIKNRFEGDVLACVPGINRLVVQVAKAGP